jgi:hypothetical protein
VNISVVDWVGVSDAVFGAIGSLLFFFPVWARVRPIVAMEINTLRHRGASTLLRRVMNKQNRSHDSQFVVPS